MDRIIFHVDVNSAFLSWSAVKRLREDPQALDLRTVPSTDRGTGDEGPAEMSGPDPGTRRP